MPPSPSCSTAHFQDGWLFFKGCQAESGALNVVFIAGINAGMSFLTAACVCASWIGGVLATLPPLAVILMAKLGHFGKLKPLALGLTLVNTVVSAAAFIAKFHSFWPLLNFVLGFCIVRCGMLIYQFDCQRLHFLPSFYAWMSHICGFGLAASPAAARAQLPVVISVGILLIFGTQRLEGAIIAAVQASRLSNGTQPIM
mmetsp:Transcript_35319/g.92702  ORF Transcript_35319/g.92702 Transcript_35319/m.92702 type:complete len:199 (-) Transcript_35319:167-763(-)